MPDDGMPQTQQNGFDRDLLSKIESILDDNDPYYLQLIYSEIKLRDQFKKKDDFKRLVDRVDEIENNHLKHLPSIEDYYRLSVAVKKLQEKLNISIDD